MPFSCGSTFFCSSLLYTLPSLLSLSFCFCTSHTFLIFVNLVVPTDYNFVMLNLPRELIIAHSLTLLISLFFFAASLLLRPPTRLALSALQVVNSVPQASNSFQMDWPQEGLFPSGSPTVWAGGAGALIESPGNHPQRKQSASFMMTCLHYSIHRLLHSLLETGKCHLQNQLCADQGLWIALKLSLIELTVFGYSSTFLINSPLSLTDL